MHDAKVNTHEARLQAIQTQDPTPDDRFGTQAENGDVGVGSFLGRERLPKKRSKLLQITRRK